MNTLPDVAAIERDLRGAYGDLAAPRFDFVARRAQSFPYGAALRELVGRGFAIVETTDINDDVAWQLVLRRDGLEVAAAISMVGPYVRLEALLPASAAASLRDEVERIFRAVPLVVVSQAMLAAPTALQLDGAAATVDEALFGATS